MPDDEYVEELRAALVKALDDNLELRKSVAGAEARADKLREIMTHEGLFKPGHEKLLARVDQSARQPIEPRFKLRLYTEPKANIVDPDIDCVARWPLCRGRCCQFEFQLTAEDVRENKVRWEPNHPYQIRHDDDAFCHHFDREGFGCKVYLTRPTTCRTFTCQNDERIWIDFEKRIPQPWTPPSTMKPIDDDTK